MSKSLMKMLSKYGVNNTTYPVEGAGMLFYFIGVCTRELFI